MEQNAKTVQKQVIVRLYQPDMDALKGAARQAGLQRDVQLKLYGQAGEVLVVIRAQAYAQAAATELTEMAAWYASQGMTLYDALQALYKKYGYYAEKTHNLVMPGLDGLKDMANLMKSLRENPPAEISGVRVAVRKDYADGSVIDCTTGEKTTMELSGSNVLRFEMADGTSVIVRPSGTEPKIKVYILTRGADAAACEANLETYGQWVASLKK